MSESIWIAGAVAVLVIIAGLLITRLRRRDQSAHAERHVFKAQIRSVGPSAQGLNQSWGAATDVVVTTAGDLHSRGVVLVGGRLKGPEPRQLHQDEVGCLTPSSQVWTVTFQDGSCVEIALTPADADHLRPWR